MKFATLRLPFKHKSLKDWVRTPALYRELQFGGAASRRFAAKNALYAHSINDSRDLGQPLKTPSNALRLAGLVILIVWLAAYVLRRNHPLKIGYAKRLKGRLLSLRYRG